MKGSAATSFILTAQDSGNGSRSEGLDRSNIYTPSCCPPEQVDAVSLFSRHETRQSLHVEPPVRLRRLLHNKLQHETYHSCHEEELVKSM